MKKIFLMMLAAVLMCSCGGSKEKGAKLGSTVYVLKECIGAVDEDSFSEMSKLCTRKDKTGLEIMEERGLIKILSYGTSGVVTDLGFGKTKIRLEDRSEYWCSSEFVK